MSSIRWLTSGAGIIGFNTRKEAAERYPDARFVRADNHWFRFWLAVESNSTENRTIILTPDDRKIECVTGYGLGEHVIGVRGCDVPDKYRDLWSEIMQRAIDVGLKMAK